LNNGILTKQNNVYKASSLATAIGVFVHADENNLIIASDSLTYTQYMAKSSKAVINKEALDRFKGKSTVFYFDIANTINGFIKDSTGAFGYDHSLRTAKQTFKDVIGTSDNFDGTSIKGIFELRMQNEKQNSLVTLTSLIADIAVDMRTQAKKKRIGRKAFSGRRSCYYSYQLISSRYILTIKSRNAGLYCFDSLYFRIQQSTSMTIELDHIIPTPLKDRFLQRTSDVWNTRIFNSTKESSLRSKRQVEQVKQHLYIFYINYARL
jgi:hypothetical protein